MSDSQIGKGQGTTAFQFGLLILTLFLLLALMADTLFLLPKELTDLIHMVDTFSCAVFFGDFCVRFYQADSKLSFMRWGWIDLIACIPNLQFLRWGRLVRVLRVIRLLRGIRCVQLVLNAVLQDRLRGGVVSVIFGVILLVCFSSASVLVCERQGDANIKTAEDAVWWSITTITTVGYGDRFPVTTEGRVIGVILMVAGVSMFGCLSGLAASFFLRSSKSKQAEIDDVLARLDGIQKTLERLSATRDLHPNPELPHESLK